MNDRIDKQDSLLLSFYGDDFTGSTDVMEALTAHGIPAALFLQPPTPEEISAFRLLHAGSAEDGRLNAFGVPGIGRSLTPEEMKAQLPELFERLARVPSRFFHYKTCSTFDSAPDLGNIAMATELALRSFPSAFAPLLVGAPALGRYCVFGNLFARAGGDVFRLDRHPTMSRHPVTPMGESDLRRHLASLGPRRSALIDLFQLAQPLAERLETLRQRASSDCPFILFDTLDEASLIQAGELLWHARQASGQLVVGSSGVEYALAAYLRDSGQLGPRPSFASPGRVKQIIALSGSASPNTSKQIQHALKLGFADIRIQTLDLLDEAESRKEIDRVVAAALAALNDGCSPMIYAACGPDDPAIAATQAAGPRPGQRIARAQAEMLRRLLETVGRPRVVVAGGDTSGYAASALDLYALEMRLPIAPGAPLCLAHSRQSAFHGLEISLKGGQNGSANYFESILCGKAL